MTAVCVTTITSVSAGRVPFRRAAGIQAQFFPGFGVQAWKDFSPRVGRRLRSVRQRQDGASNANIARFVAADGVSTAAANNPQTTVGRTDLRTWNDLNGDYTIYNADGSLQANELGPTTTSTSGRSFRRPTRRIHDAERVQRPGIFDRVAGGRAARADAARRADRRLLLPLQRETRLVTDNTLINGERLRRPVLHHGAGEPGPAGRRRYPVCGLYDVKVASRSLQQNNTTFARNFGGITDHYMGYDVTVAPASSNGGTLQGGVNSQKRVDHTCNAPIPSGAAATASQVDSPESRFCHQVLPYRPDFKLLAAYNLPYNFSVSGTCRELRPGDHRPPGRRRTRSFPRRSAEALRPAQRRPRASS